MTVYLYLYLLVLSHGMWRHVTSCRRVLLRWGLFIVVWFWVIFYSQLTEVSIDLRSRYDLFLMSVRSVANIAIFYYAASTELITFENNFPWNYAYVWYYNSEAFFLSRPTLCPSIVVYHASLSVCLLSGVQVQMKSVYDQKHTIKTYHISGRTDYWGLLQSHTCSWAFKNQCQVAIFFMPLTSHLCLFSLYYWHRNAHLALICRWLCANLYLNSPYFLLHS